uniref:Uncharacterized protein n=1 Tax=uncultured Desulfobacterium sp. TaxID=201089 RepID=E1YLL7_9BACT|nr:unknown protein [uncultured Desulfobacterium sp.]
MNTGKSLKIRGCLLVIGIGLMGIGGSVVINRSPGTKIFSTPGLTLKISQY